MERKKIPRNRLRAVLYKSRRRCAFCFYFEQDTDVKDGQLAHIDRDSSNNDESNLAYLCLNHHNEYDTIPRQTKKLTPEELREAKKQLEEFINVQHAKTVPSTRLKPYPKSTEEINQKAESVTIELYNLRYPIYREFRDFVLHIVQEGDLDLSRLYTFRKNTHDALFLYGKEVEDYLVEIDLKAQKLSQYQCRMNNRPDRFTQEQWDEMIKDETKLILWFSDSLTKGKRLFAKYLSLGDR